MHIDNGIYFIIPNNAGYYSDLALDVPGGAGGDGVLIQQFGWHGGPNQQWQLTSQEYTDPESGQVSHFYTIVNVFTGKALDVPNGLPIPGLPIQQFSLHGGPNQQWRFVSFPAVGPTPYHPDYATGPPLHRIFNRASGLALDVPNGSHAWGVTIQQFTPHAGLNQTWILKAPD